MLAKMFRFFFRIGVGGIIIWILGAMFGYIESPVLLKAWGVPAWKSVDFRTPPPDISSARVMIDKEGTTVNFASVAAKGPYFAMIYGDWCGICRRKMPYLLERAEEMKAAGAPLLLIGDRRSRFEGWKRHAGGVNTDAVTSVIDEENTVFRRANVIGVPTFALITQEGKIGAVFEGMNVHAENLPDLAADLAALGAKP